MKKGDLKLIVNIMIYSVAGVILFWIFFYPDSSLLAQVSKMISSPKNITFSTSSANLEVPKDAEAVYNTIIAALNTGLKSKDARCLITSNKFSDFKDSKIVLGNVADGMTIGINDKFDRTVKETSLLGIKPCLVAIMGGVDFYGNYFEKKSLSPEFIEIKSLQITSATDMIGDGMKYSIDNNGCIGTINKNILYKADANHICFIPTRNGGCSCAVNDIGILDDDCLSNTQEGILSKVKPCSIS